jgi:hypothetical protein
MKAEQKVFFGSSSFFFWRTGHIFTLSWGGATATTGVYSSKSPDTVIE